MSERDKRALREALQALGSDEPVDPGAARHRAAERRRNGRALAGIAVALVLVTGVVGLPRLFPADQGQTAAGGAEAGADSRQGQQPQAGAPSPAAEDQAPDRWRTEYYRDISFQVPVDWGYAVPPSPRSWCAGPRDGTPRPVHLKPYVWLRTSVAERAIACEPMPNSLLSEHVVALEPGPAEDYVEGSSEVAGWSIVTRFVGSAILVVTTKDRDRAEQILDSATVVTDDTPCPLTSPVAGPLGTRPGKPTDLDALGDVDHVVLCQYEVDPEPVADRSRLRAAHLVTGRAADQLVAELQSAPLNDQSCNSPPLDGLPEIAVLARVTAGDRTSDLHIAAAGCPEGDRGMAGGIDDGTKVRLLTRDACRLVMTPPIALFTGSGDVGRNCVT